MWASYYPPGRYRPTGRSDLYQIGGTYYLLFYTYGGDNWHAHNPYFDARKEAHNLMWTDKKGPHHWADDDGHWNCATNWERNAIRIARGSADRYCGDEPYNGDGPMWCWAYGTGQVTI